MLPVLKGRSDFPIHVLTRLVTAPETAQANADALEKAFPVAVKREIQGLLDAATKSKRSQETKNLMLWRAADLLGKYAVQFSGCKSGCSHCCFIPVAVSPAEA